MNSSQWQKIWTGGKHLMHLHNAPIYIMPSTKRRKIKGGVVEVTATEKKM